MKKLLAAITALGLSITSPGIANAQRYTEFVHQDNSYFQRTLNSRYATYYKYKVPAYTFGVFTVKNHSHRSDFDVFVRDYSGNLLAKGRDSGTQTELVTTQPFERDRYVYIQIVNYGSQASKYRFYANYVSPMNKFAIAFAETAIVCSLERDNIPNQTTSRIITGISSMLQGNDLGGIAEDLLINEVTDTIRKQFGYDCTGDFMVNWIVSIFRGFYRNH